MFSEIRKQKNLLYLFSLGLLIRLTLAWLPEKYLFYLVSDDAYYYFSIARNLVERGMLSVDGISETNGFHPLWLFVITPIFLLFKSFPWFSIHLVLTLSAIFDTLAAFLIYKTLGKLGKEKVGFWTAAFYLVNPYGLFHTMNGLETAQNNFFLSLLIYLSLKASVEWLKTGWFYLGVVCGLALLSRTDNVFVVAALLGYLIWRDKNFPVVVKTAGLAAVLFTPWLVYNYLTFGSIIQTSGAAYPFHYYQQYLNEYKTFFNFALIPYLIKVGFYNYAFSAFHFGNWILTLIPVGLLLFQLRNWPVKYRPLLWALIGAVLFLAVHVFVRWSVRPWYGQAAFVLTLPIVALTFEKVNRYLLALGMFLALYFSGQRVWSEPFTTVDRSRTMLDIIKNQVPPDERVGVFNSGFVQYFTDRQVINLDGLVNNEVLSYYKRKEGLEYFRQNNIRWLVDTWVYLSGTFGPYFGPAAESSLVLVQDVPNTSYPGLTLFVVKVLPVGQRPPPGQDMPINREWAFRRKWERIPFFFKWRT